MPDWHACRSVLRCVRVRHRSTIPPSRGCANAPISAPTLNLAGSADEIRRPPLSTAGPGIQPASRTLFNTPLVTPALRAVARTLFRFLGWRFEGLIPTNLQQAVVIGAPHTSNWDLPYMLMAAFVLERELHWLGKAQIFRFPFGGLMRWMGGIPVDRSRANNLVDAAIQCFTAERAPLLLLVPPRAPGRRSRRGRLASTTSRSVPRYRW